MNIAGDAANEVLKITLDGTDFVLRLAGTGAKELIAMLYAISKDHQKSEMGKKSLANMLRKCKDIKIFSLQRKDLEKFVREGKRYGIMYCTLLDKDDKSPNSVVDILVRAEDAQRVDRIVEKYHLSITNTASLSAESKEKSQEEIKSGEVVEANEKIESPEQKEARTKKNKLLLSQIRGSTSNNNEVEQSTVIITQEPIEEFMEESENGVSHDFFMKDNQSENFLESKGDLNNDEKPSVKKDLQDIKKQRQKQSIKNTKEKTRTKKNKKRNKKQKMEVKRNDRTR